MKKVTFENPIQSGHGAALAMLVFLAPSVCGQNNGIEITPVASATTQFTRRQAKNAPSTVIRDLEFTAEALLSPSGLDFKSISSAADPIPTWNMPLAVAVPGMPQSGGALPPGLRFPIPPGVTYARPPRLAQAHPSWLEAQQLIGEIRRSNIDPSVKQQLEVQWPWLSLRQAELMDEAATIDASWDSIQPKFESTLDRHSETYWHLQDVFKEYQRDESAALSHCGRQLLPGEDLAAAQRECAEIGRKLDARLADLNSKADQNAASYKAETARLLSPHNALITAINPRLDHWHTRLGVFIEAAKKALASNQSQNAFVKYLVKKYKLDICQHDHIHRAISKQNKTDEEIEELAAELAATGDYRCPPGRQQ